MEIKMSNVRALAEKSAEAAKTINNSDYKKRHLALSDMAEALRQNAAFILEENEKDLAAARETLNRVREFVKNNPTIYLSTHTPEGVTNLEEKIIMKLD